MDGSLSFCRRGDGDALMLSPQNKQGHERAQRLVELQDKALAWITVESVPKRVRLWVWGSPHKQDGRATDRGDWTGKRLTHIHPQSAAGDKSWLRDGHMPAGVMSSKQASKQAHGLVQREGAIVNPVAIEFQVQARLQRHGPVLFSIHSCVRGVSLRLGTGQARMLVDGLTMRRGNWLVSRQLAHPHNSQCRLSLSSFSVFVLSSSSLVCRADRPGIKRKWGDCEDERFSSSAWEEQTIDLPLIANGPLHDIAWPDPQRSL
ncbi:hypothetical protein V8C34DRAFT_268632 [Trichoderma compactum]